MKIAYFQAFLYGWAASIVLEVVYEFWQLSWLYKNA